MWVIFSAVFGSFLFVGTWNEQIKLFSEKNYQEAPGGVEPSTFRLLGGRSNQLSYRACVASLNVYTFQLVYYLEATVTLNFVVVTEKYPAMGTTEKRM